jgi:hypothetical protein
MSKAVSTWVDGLRSRLLSKEEAWLALQSTILRMLYYPLPALRLSKAQCESILAPLLRFCLPSLGICRNFPRKLVFSTFDYKGLNFLHQFTIQEIYRLKDIIFPTANDTLTGRLYLSSLELLLLVLGCNTRYLWDPALIDLLATDSLIKSTWCFLFTYGIFLVHSVCLDLPREKDSFIMEVLLTLGIPQNEIKVCNH